MNMPDDSIAPATARYEPAQLSPAEFEQFVASLFESLAGTRALSELRVENHEVIRGVDGAYDFDATVRFDVAGMGFLVLVEAKCHRNPIKRELVQVLHQKLQSVGAQKAVLVSTAPFQSGALEFALAHGIALVTVTEGRFTYETKSVAPSPALSRDEAAAYGLPIFVGHGYSRGESPGSVRVTIMSPEFPEYVAEHLLPSR